MTNVAMAIELPVILAKELSKLIPIESKVLARILGKATAMARGISAIRIKTIPRRQDCLINNVTIPRAKRTIPAYKHKYSAD